MVVAVTAFESVGRAGLCLAGVLVVVYVALWIDNARKDRRGK